VKPFAEIAETQVAEGERVGSTMAGLVEEVRWRTSAKGRRYMMATLSDSSGQFVATAFDDEATAALEAAAKGGQCGLLSVELDRRAGDETPRVTIKRIQPLTDLAKRTRLQMTVRVPDAATAERTARELANARGSNGVLRFIVPVVSGGEAVVVAGRDYALDAELAARIERITGEGSVDLSVQEPPKLALVG
jgi:DNA polymerase-3 subunit alpha